ncbi:MAG TPA: MmgE/PrpD family protein [Dehalococcoidia bacterium]|jgi:2-methylcitrate dehydratase PrpD|nr:MmgE/PrpD family protein [Dehalococcoidia bacterium]
MSTLNPEAQLAEFITSLELSSVESTIQHEAKRTLVNLLAVSLSASQHPTASSLFDLIDEEGGNPRASIISQKNKVSIYQAAFANGYLAHLQDFDDTHFPTVLHPSAPVWPGVIAVGQALNSSGTAVLEAGIIGLEIACRAAMSVHPWHYDMGWHITGTAGVFGAAAGAAKLLGLSETETIQALGLAGTQSAGIRETFGTAGKPMHAGHAAASGVNSALLIKKGFSGPTTIFSGRRGWWAVYSPDGHDSQRLTTRLGEDWELLNNGLKPYANGVVSHPIQDAIIKLREENQLSPEHVKSIDLKVNPLVFELMDRPRPMTGLDGKFSFQHCAAAALVDGAGTDAQFTDERVLDEEIANIRDLVTASINTEYEEDQAEATITTTQGSIHTVEVKHATGSPSNPLSDIDLEQKYQRLTEVLVGSLRSQKLYTSVMALDAISDINEVMELCEELT